MVEAKEKQEVGEFVPDPYMMAWCKSKLPKSWKGYFLCDCDLIARDTSGNIRLIELKRKTTIFG